MIIFGIEIRRHRKGLGYLSNVPYRGGWQPWVHEPYTGAWQRNDDCYVTDNVLSNATVFRCATLIANSVAKMELRLVQKTDDGIWQEVTATNPFAQVLRQPNETQNRIQFIQQWVTSLELNGNCYALKRRDQRNVVNALYILDPLRVRPLIAPSGDVFYELSSDNLAAIGDQVRVPASEIIHDRINAIYHPLCGMSPIYAAGLAAMQGLRIQSHSERFFANGARPGGMLIAPDAISDDDVARLKASFQQQYSGPNIGKILIAHMGMKYERLELGAGDQQMIETLRWTSENICSAFGVPGFKVGIGQTPSYNNIEALERSFYADCLQILIEQIEAALDTGLELPRPYGTEFNRDDLLGMDARTMAETIRVAVQAGVLAPNEGRKKINLGPVEGGTSPYLQQQNYSLAALNKRDQQADPFGRAAPKPPAPAPTPGGREVISNAMAARTLKWMNANAAHH